MKRRIWYKILSIGVVWSILWCILYSPVMASEADYVITPIITGEDLEGDKRCFDLTVEPSRKRVVEVEVRNNTDGDVTVYTEVYTAVMSENGVVEYIDANTQEDTIEKRLSQFVAGDGEIIIPAEKSYLFQFTVNMPAEGLDYPVMGGLVFLVTPNPQEEITDTAHSPELGMQRQEGTELLKLSTNALDQAEVIRAGLELWLQEKDIASSVSAAFSYVVPLLLKTGESTASPSLTLEDISVQDDRSEIKAKIQNKTSIPGNQITIDAIVHKKGKKKVYFEASEENIEIPAHFDYELSIPAKGTAVEAGEYTLQLKLTAGDIQWQWKKDFTIGQEGANAAVKSGSDIPETDTKSGWRYFIIITVIFLMAATVTIFIMMLGKKRKEEEAIIKAIKNIKKNTLPTYGQRK